MTSEKLYQSSKIYDLTATISSGQTTSAAIDLSGVELAGLFIPSTFDGSAVGIQAASAVDGTYLTVQDGAGADFSVPVTAGKYVPISTLAVTAGLRFIKLVAGTAQSGGDTVITLALRPI
jgi:hypothetical protein